MTSPSAAPPRAAPPSDSNTGPLFQSFRALGFLVLLLMIVSIVYAAVIIIQNWNVISV